MDFLNKLYESNYFGIGLFAVISFLVVTFLVVLFFGKKDEKKRKLEETNNIRIDDNIENTFKETSVIAPVEMPIIEQPEPIAQVMPVNDVPVTPITPIEEVEQTNFDSIPLQPVAPISYEIPEVEEQTEFVENLTVEEPVKTEEPAIESIPVMPVNDIEPIKYDIPVEPKVMEPIKFSIPAEPIKVEPIIKEEENPILTPFVEQSPIVEEPVIKETYYEPIEEPEIEEIKVPNIDFDALAQSISKELDELEKSTNTSRYEEVKVTPINEISNKPTNQFSSVYVNEPIKKVTRETLDLPKKIDLPTMKSEQIEPESYNL